MKTITTTAIVALMSATIGLSTLPPTFAQDAAPTQVEAQRGPGFNMRHHHQGPGKRDGMRGGADLLSFERGGEAIEIALVRLSHRITLTAEQQPLFDTFKAAALSAAADFATATADLRPAAPAEGVATPAPTLSKRLENGIALQSARLAALEAVQPAAAAFFDSLTDAQNAQLTPQRPQRDGQREGFSKSGGPRHHDQQQDGPAAPATNG